ncbi:hypothetical protein [Acinetobacter colistiniresistens]|uniref:hypothetical protein n=1 Tax=Acinetobacter colistiniresistens TaxID=280145 RepID=UPI001250880B|nr:hypothetical protein [Acinetobacter colistiniresistens]
MSQSFNKVVYLEAVNPSNNSVFEIKTMNKKGDGVEIHLTNGEIVSGSEVRYARECEQKANTRLPHH